MAKNSSITMRLSRELWNELRKLKIIRRETYDDVIRRLIEKFVEKDNVEDIVKMFLPSALQHHPSPSFLIGICEKCGAYSKLSYKNGLLCRGCSTGN